MSENELQGMVRRVNAWLATVIIVTIAVLAGYTVLETFWTKFSPMTSSLPGRAQTVELFVGANIYMIFVIFALMIVAAVVAIFLWPMKHSDVEIVF